jgi:hypothetical protein
MKPKEYAQDEMNQDILKFNKALEELKNISQDVERDYQDGKLTHREYLQLKRRLIENMCLLGLMG